MKRCHGHLHYDRKFQIFIFLIGHINDNKGVFCLIISYLQIKSYNVLNYNNCSTDWPFPLGLIQEKIPCRVGTPLIFFLSRWGALNVFLIWGLLSNFYLINRGCRYFYHFGILK
jgi:hypothetical protein